MQNKSDVTFENVHRIGEAKILFLFSIKCKVLYVTFEQIHGQQMQNKKYKM